MIARFKPIVLTLALAAAVPVGVVAQQPASPPDAGADAHPAEREILKSIQGYGSKFKVPPLQAADNRYLLKSGDQLSVNFTLATQYNESVTVRPDGYISVIGAPDVYVAGQTVPQATESIRKGYEGVLVNPLLTVALKNFESPYFVVGGEVKNPGKFVLHGDTTVAQSIAIAGGFNGTTAKDSAALLLRRVSRDYVQAKLIDLKGIDQGDISEDVHLQSGDMVFIPKNRLSKVQPFLDYFLAYNVVNFNLTSNVTLGGAQ